MAINLNNTDRLHLRAAEGWLELGCHLDANEELENIAAAHRAHPDVLELRWQIYAHAKDWTACLEIASAITRMSPERAVGWIHRSYTLHELHRTQEAFDFLQPAAQNFPKVWTIPYNLACYCARLCEKSGMPLNITPGRTSDKHESHRRPGSFPDPALS